MLSFFYTNQISNYATIPSLFLFFVYFLLAHLLSPIVSNHFSDQLAKFLVSSQEKIRALQYESNVYIGKYLKASYNGIEQGEKANKAPFELDCLRRNRMSSNH